jgi:hypothetical protein
VTILRWTVRLSGLLALLLGLGLWKGAWFNLLAVHQGLGLLMGAALIWLAVLGWSRRVSPVLLGLALLCGLAVPALGYSQQRLLPGQSHWITEVLHLVLGLGAIALAELMGSRMRVRPAPVPSGSV